MFQMLQKLISNSWTQSAFDFLQGATLCLNDVTRYVQDSKETHRSESQVHRTDSKLIYDTQEVEPDHKIRYLFKWET